MPSFIARSLRRRPTEAEARLWQKLRNRQIEGIKFCRQMPIGPYIVDFAARAVRLIVEIDGGQHASSVKADELRSRRLAAEGYRVIRFWNNDVLGNMSGVLEKIREALLESR
jgi:very-short-patch-repair endonuclease